MKYKCPCCGNRTLLEKTPGTYQICPICKWEDDEIQFNNPDYKGGANKINLNKSKENYQLNNLLVYMVLCKSKMIGVKEYNNKLDNLFIENSDFQLLLDLEMCSNNIQNSWEILQQYLYDNKISYNYDTFGRILFEELKKIYNSKKVNIEEFGKKAYEIWKLLPDEIMQKEPFWTLSYADDCMSWGDENQTRKLYEKAFEYYSDTK